MTGALYDTIGTTYAATRRPDPRIQAAIWDAIGDAGRVLNVGAGTGSYEPPSTVIAVEPSLIMIAQRPPGLAPVLVTTAEAIPLPDGFVDCALVVLAAHHFGDLPRALAELRRLARRIVIVTWDAPFANAYWLVREYLPELAAYHDLPAASMAFLEAHLGPLEVRPLLVPHDCSDGFAAAYWRRPEAYLDPLVRAGISFLARLGERADPGLARLAEDVASGAWRERHRDLLAHDELDVGYRIVIASG